MTFLLRGEVAHSAGWLARAERLVEQGDRTCAARGLLLVPTFLEALGNGDLVTALEHADQIVEIGRAVADNDVIAFGMLARGQAALSVGDIGRAMKLFDEVMVSVTTGEVSPIPAGIVYCAVIEACIDICDVGRAAEWTDFLVKRDTLTTAGAIFAGQDVAVMVF